MQLPERFAQTWREPKVTFSPNELVGEVLPSCYTDALALAPPSHQLGCFLANHALEVQRGRVRGERGR
eukprot:3406535-Prymnesium_polylepis.1